MTTAKVKTLIDDVFYHFEQSYAEHSDLEPPVKNYEVLLVLPKHLSATGKSSATAKSHARAGDVWRIGVVPSSKGINGGTVIPGDRGHRETLELVQDCVRAVVAAYKLEDENRCLKKAMQVRVLSPPPFINKLAVLIEATVYLVCQ